MFNTAMYCKSLNTSVNSQSIPSFSSDGSKCSSGLMTSQVGLPSKSSCSLEAMAFPNHMRYIERTETVSTLGIRGEAVAPHLTEKSDNSVTTGYSGGRLFTSLSDKCKNLVSNFINLSPTQSNSVGASGYGGSIQSVTCSTTVVGATGYAASTASVSYLSTSNYNSVNNGIQGIDFRNC